jgi:hypothetical protein
VPWITIQSKKDVDYFDLFLNDINLLKKRFKTNKIILLPFAHLTEKIASGDVSFLILEKLKIFLQNNDFDVKMAHFGSAKDLTFISPADEYQVIHRSYPLNTFKANFKFK